MVQLGKQYEAGKIFVRIQAPDSRPQRLLADCFGVQNHQILIFNIVKSVKVSQSSQTHQSSLFISS